MPPAQRLLQAARSLWNLRQFDLAGAHPRRACDGRTIGQAMSPPQGLAGVSASALLLAMIIGLNLWAWHQTERKSRRGRRGSRPLVEDLRASSAGDVQRDARGGDAARDALWHTQGPATADLEPMLQAAAAPGGESRRSIVRIELGP